MSRMRPKTDMRTQPGYDCNAAESDMPLGIQYGLRSRDGAENRALENPDVAVAFPSDADGNLRGTIYRMAPRHLNPNNQ